MTEPARFDPATHTVGLTRDLRATLGSARPDQPVPVDGVTIGVATMSQNAPHGGEMHPDGDEVLLLIRGRVRVILETSPVQELEMEEGSGLVVPRGVWHRVDVLEPCQVAYVTRGPRHEQGRASAECGQQPLRAQEPL